VAGQARIALPRAPPVKLVVVSFWWYERPRFEFAGVLPANQCFLEWRDPDSNRGHYDFQVRPASYCRPPSSSRSPAIIQQWERASPLWSFPPFPVTLCHPLADERLGVSNTPSYNRHAAVNFESMVASSIGERESPCFIRIRAP
jgi:hypothetical protein